MDLLYLATILILFITTLVLAWGLDRMGRAS